MIWQLRLQELYVLLLTKLAGGTVSRNRIEKLAPTIRTALNEIKLQDEELTEIRGKYLRTREQLNVERAMRKRLEKQVKELKEFINQ